MLGFTNGVKTLTNPFIWLYRSSLFHPLRNLPYCKALIRAAAPSKRNMFLTRHSRISCRSVLHGLALSMFRAAPLRCPILHLKAQRVFHFAPSNPQLRECEVPLACFTPRSRKIKKSQDGTSKSTLYEPALDLEPCTRRATLREEVERADGEEFRNERRLGV